MKSLRFAVMAATGFAACNPSEVSRLPPADEVATLSSEVELEGKLDLLFVIDDSCSMNDEQDALTASFDDFIAELRKVPGALSLHIGVVTTDVGIAPYATSGCVGNGDDGVLQDGEGLCPMRDRYLIDETGAGGERSVNYSGSFEDAFWCIAHVGTRGCGIEQPLESMRRALVDQAGPDGPNHDFLRPDASLAVIIISDEDDCSPADPEVWSSDAARFGPWSLFRCQRFGVICDGQELTGPGSYSNCEPRPDSYIRDPQEFVDALVALKGDSNKVYVSTLTGDPKPFTVEQDGNQLYLDVSCFRPATQTTPASWASPGVRLRWFAQAFARAEEGARSLCHDDFTSTMRSIGAELGARLSPCLSGDLDVRDLSSDEPGLQIDCQVALVHDRGLSDESQTTVRRCGMDAAGQPDEAGLPCWWVEPNITACGETPTHLALHVERDPEVVLPEHTAVVASCLHAR